METVTKNDFDKILIKDNWFKNRWSYFRPVIEMVKEINPSSVLELGPRNFPLVKNSDVMDKYKHLPKIKYLRDATDIPWPIPNKKYDLFIALEVFEHLGDKQKEAFKQVIRISNAAILSFPYKWHMPGNVHHNIDKKKISDWTLGTKPDSGFYVDRGKRNILIYKWIFQK